MSDLYQLLQIPRTASLDDIKRAWKRAALKEHPDKGGSNERFQQIQQAYSVLSDPESRKRYDSTGATAPARPRPATGQVRIRTKGPNLLHTIQVALADLWTGRTYRLRLTKQVFCKECAGKGLLVGSTKRCILCFAGKGRDACTMCKGTGWPICVTCKGTGKIDEQEILSVVVAPGDTVPAVRKFPEMCAKTPQYLTPGDVIVTLQPTPADPAVAAGWKRVGRDFHRPLLLTAEEASTGWLRTLPAHPSSRPLKICWTHGKMSPRECIRLKGWGMPLTDASGATVYGDVIFICTTVAADRELTPVEKAEVDSGNDLDPADTTIQYPCRFFDRK
jgi:DnaJ family protein A protein 2